MNRRDSLGRGLSLAPVSRPRRLAGSWSPSWWPAAARGPATRPRPAAPPLPRPPPPPPLLDHGSGDLRVPRDGHHRGPPRRSGTATRWPAAGPVRHQPPRLPGGRHVHGPGLRLRGPRGRPGRRGHPDRQLAPGQRPRGRPRRPLGVAGRRRRRPLLGSHLEAVAPGIAPGVRVRAGQSLGRIGNSGSARVTPVHLHFGISWPTRPGIWWVRRGWSRPRATWTPGGAAANCPRSGRSGRPGRRPGARCPSAGPAAERGRPGQRAAAASWHSAQTPAMAWWVKSGRNPWSRSTSRSRLRSELRGRSRAAPQREQVRWACWTSSSRW